MVLVDISGSMNAYSLFLVRFAYALQKHFKRVNTFLQHASFGDYGSISRTAIAGSVEGSG